MLEKKKILFLKNQQLFEILACSKWPNLEDHPYFFVYTDFQNECIGLELSVSRVCEKSKHMERGDVKVLIEAIVSYFYILQKHTYMDREG